MPLSDHLIVYPNHGAGSACGKMMTKEEFVKELLTGLTAPPGYFPQNVLMNIKGYGSWIS